MPEQLNLFDYRCENCRHHTRYYCYWKKNDKTKECNYEEKKSCDGCKHQGRLGQNISSECILNGGCYRWCWNPDVNTSNLEDRYEQKGEKCQKKRS